MPESTGFASAPRAASSGVSSPGGKGGPGGLPMANSPLLPYWAQARQASGNAPQTAPTTTPAMNPPSYGAGRFLNTQGPNVTIPRTSGTGTSGGPLMGGAMTPTATPVAQATKAPITLRPPITPSIYEQWQGYNKAAQQKMETPLPGENPADVFARTPEGKRLIANGMKPGGIQFDNAVAAWIQLPRNQQLFGVGGGLTGSGNSGGAPGGAGISPA